ncbi:MAG TPA: glycosyltransferase family 39 protein, partial [bacterium]|nr:glycosyltransferase family 39 protein [bacterium]
ATAVAAALCAIAARVPAVDSFISKLGDPGLWLKYALCFAAPAVLWAVALARLAPRLALRFAGVIVQRWFVALRVVAAAVGVVYAASQVLGDASADADESAFVFQSKIFCRGKLAAWAPATEGDAARAFFRAETDVVRNGRWFSSYAPLHPALLCLGAKLGWPKLVGVAAAVLILISAYAIGRRVSGAFGGAVAAVLVATSPAFIFTQASYLSEASFLCFFALALWACLRAADSPSRGAMAALGAAAGAAFLVSEYGALYLALPFGWFLWRRLRTHAGRGNRALWLVAGAAPLFALWVLYNWRQTGNFLMPPRLFADAAVFGFDEGYNIWAALSACARNLVVLSTDGFGWPLLCLVPAVVRLFLKPRLGDFEKALYAAVVLTVVAHLPLRSGGSAFGARFYYPAWLCLTFITARFFVILAALAQRRFDRAGEGLAALVLTALVAVNMVIYMPRAAARYGGRAGGNHARWADAGVRRAVAALGIDDAVVIIRPREWCLSSTPGSPFLDDAVVYARDNGERNGELKKIFPGRVFYLLDYADFTRAGEITALDFDVEQ